MKKESWIVGVAFILFIAAWIFQTGYTLGQAEARPKWLDIEIQMQHDTQVVCKGTTKLCADAFSMTCETYSDKCVDSLTESAKTEVHVIEIPQTMECLNYTFVDTKSNQTVDYFYCSILCMQNEQTYLELKYYNQPQQGGKYNVILQTSPINNSYCGVIVTEVVK